MRVLVTGSDGFVGRHFARALLQLDEPLVLVDAVDLPNHDCRQFFAAPCRHHYDLVLHCAAMVDGREAIDGKPALIGAYNLQLDGALFEWALRARPGRIVYFSSSAAYPVAYQNHCGPGDALVESDCDGGEPDATYGWVKLTGERIAREVRKTGVPVTIVRPFSGYGEDQDDCYPFPAMIARAKQREDPFVVWGDGQQVRDFIHVDDIVAGTLALVTQRVDGPVNLGTGRPTSMDDLARLAMEAAGYAAPIKHLSDRPQGVRYRVADPSLLHRHYTPKVTLEQGIERALTANRAEAWATT